MLRVSISWLLGNTVHTWIHFQSRRREATVWRLQRQSTELRQTKTSVQRYAEVKCNQKDPRVCPASHDVQWWRPEKWTVHHVRRYLPLRLNVSIAVSRARNESICSVLDPRVSRELSKEGINDKSWRWYSPLDQDVNSVVETEQRWLWFSASNYRPQPPILPNWLP